MYNENDLKAQCATGRIGFDEPAARPGLRERISSQRQKATAEARRAEHLHELEYLIEKHPEVARMLELLEYVKQ